ncbi:hypothetical protein GCM10027565_38500 [Bordetella tumulicola]
MQSQETLSTVDVATLQLIDTTDPAVLSRTKRLIERWSSRWRGLFTRRARKRTADALSTLNARALQDIGVPESMLYESNAIRQLERSYDTSQLWS